MEATSATDVQAAARPCPKKARQVGRARQGVAEIAVTGEELVVPAGYAVISRNL